MTKIKRTMIASLLIEQAGKMKHKRPTELGFEELIDVVQSVVKNCSIHNVSVSLFNDALRVLRDLAEHQNGVPLTRNEKEYNETIQEVWDFLEANET